MPSTVVIPHGHGALLSPTQAANRTKSGAWLSTSKLLSQYPVHRDFSQIPLLQQGHLEYWSRWYTRSLWDNYLARTRDRDASFSPLWKLTVSQFRDKCDWPTSWHCLVQLPPQSQTTHQGYSIHRLHKYSGDVWLSSAPVNNKSLSQEVIPQHLGVYSRAPSQEVRNFSFHHHLNVTLAYMFLLPFSQYGNLFSYQKKHPRHILRGRIRAIFVQGLKSPHS